LRLAPSYFNSGAVRFLKGDLDGAIRDQTQAIKLDPRFAGACSDRCAIRQLKGDLDGDSADCSRAIELDARNATAYFNLAAI
jgi:Flp pilus assembly protein TadD